MNIEAGVKFVDRYGSIYEIIEVVDQGYDPNDPEDYGSFQECIVHYTLDGKRYCCQDYEFEHLIRTKRLKENG